MNVYRHASYKTFLKAWIASQPDKGRGQKSRIAEHLGIQSSMLSQILSGDKELSLEQATKLGRYLGFDADESEYLLDLVQLERAGSHDLRVLIERRLERARLREKGAAKILRNTRSPDESVQAEYYSNWYYVAIRVLTEVPQFQDAGSIATRLGLPIEVVNRVLRFLVKAGLCEEAGKKIRAVPGTFSPSLSTEWANQHLRNWRIKALERIGLYERGECSYTLTMAVSDETEREIYDLVVECAKKILAKMQDSTGPNIRNFNIDWLRVK